ncbi:MAG: hypothetical protein QXR58_01365 [Candidatus Micrarchaeaceae archaeon]
MLEIETKIEEVDIGALKSSLESHGAEFKGRKLLRRWIYYLQSGEGEDRYLRIRTNGDSASITYKRRIGEGLSNTEELETEVKNFDSAVEIFRKVLGEGHYQENFRSSYIFEGAEITIDEWPKLKPVVEVEAKSEEKIRQVIETLGIKGKEVGNIGWDRLYALHGINLRDFNVLKVDEA